jgi:hypothetical protein
MAYKYGHDKGDGVNPEVLEEMRKEYDREGWPVKSPKYKVVAQRQVDISGEPYYIEQREYLFEKQIPWSYWHCRGLPQLSCYPTYQEARAALEAYLDGQYLS